MKPIVFLGPSLAHDAAAKVLDAEFRGPAAAGDLLAAAQRKPTAIVLIDGYFARVPAVWHKEILYALALGIPVYGGASMGALRAAELHAYGMVGVGTIFQRYCDGTFEDDDEVAVLHAPAMFGFRAFSDAMVNLRDGLALAREEGLIKEAEQTALVADAKSKFYPERSWRRLAEAGERLGLDAGRVASLTEWAAERQPNSKRDDALAVLARVRDDLLAQHRPPPADFVFEHTIFWERLVDSLGGRVATDTSNLHALAWAKLRGPATIWQSAMLRHLARGEARRRGWQVSSIAQTQALDAMRREHDLLTEDAFTAWQSANAIGAATLTRLLNDDALLAEFARSDTRSIDRAMVDELKLSEAWPALQEEAGKQSALAQRHGAASPLPETVGISEAELLEWYTINFRPIGGDIERHARQLGFLDASEFRIAATRAYLASGHDPMTANTGQRSPQARTE